MVGQPLINVSHCSLRSVCIHCIAKCEWGYTSILKKQTWCHMAQNLGPIESHPVKGGMWENVTVYTRQLCRGKRIEKTYILFLYRREMISQSSKPKKQAHTETTSGWRNTSSLIPHQTPFKKEKKKLSTTSVFNPSMGWNLPCRTSFFNRAKRGGYNCGKVG